MTALTSHSMLTRELVSPLYFIKKIIAHACNEQSSLPDRENDIIYTVIFSVFS